MAKTTYGYARVSSCDQNLNRQLDALAAFGVPAGNVFTDRASGKDFERPAWRSLMALLGEGDVLVVGSIDRLGRNYSDVLGQWRVLTKGRGVCIVVLDMPLLDTRRKESGVTGELIADIVLQLLSYVAQVERESIRQRQAEGIRAAKARGVHLGRPRKERPREFLQVKRAYQAGRCTRVQAAAALQCGVSTFDKWLREESEGEAIGFIGLP